MRKILLSAATFLTILTATAQVPSYVSTNGLVGYWPFNGNAQDESGNGNNGYVNEATLTTDRNGIVNSAYSFDGVNDNISTSRNSLSSFSVSLWFYTTQNDEYTSFIDAYNGNWEIYLKNLKPTFTKWISLPGNYQEFISTTNANQNQWNHLVFTFSGGVIKFYLNNILISIFQNATLSTSTNGIYYFGASISGISQFYNGKLDDIGIWNRSLTDQEITALYTECKTLTATITPQTGTTFCQGGSVNLNASTGTNYTYEWYNNGNIINNATSSIYNATSSGNYTVKVTDGACNATSTIKTVTVNTIPNVTLNVLNNVIYKTSLPVQLVGNPDGGTYIGEAITGSTFTPANATLGKKTISYNYTSQQGCSGSASQTTIVVDSVGNVCSTYDTLKIKVKFTLGLYANTTNTIKFYPNPTKDILFIDNGNYQAMNGYSIKIVSLTGTVVYNKPITSQQVQISMNQFATKGLYIAQILDSNNAIVDSKKIVLE